MAFVTAQSVTDQPAATCGRLGMDLRAARGVEISCVSALALRIIAGSADAAGQVKQKSVSG
jgi:hypothetical protein